MIYTHAAAALLAGVIAATGAYKIQEWRYGAKEAEHAEQQLENERLAAKAALRNADRVIEAQNKAEAHARGLRRDADGARVAAISLHDAAAAAMRDAAVSHAACIDSASKLKVVFLECSRNYEEVARDADNWENDAVMLRDAWPK